jgi:hypothetical protein
MKKNKKIVFVSIGLVLILILLNLILDFPYRSRIPDLPESDNISEQLASQIKSASLKAKFYPSARNLGILGMFITTRQQCVIVLLPKRTNQNGSGIITMDV